MGAAGWGKDEWREETRDLSFCLSPHYPPAHHNVMPAPDVFYPGVSSSDLISHEMHHAWIHLETITRCIMPHLILIPFRGSPPLFERRITLWRSSHKQVPFEFLERVNLRIVMIIVTVSCDVDSSLFMGVVRPPFFQMWIVLCKKVYCSTHTLQWGWKNFPLLLYMIFMGKNNREYEIWWLWWA